jgi:hypothetical protein
MSVVVGRLGSGGCKCWWPTLRQLADGLPSCAVFMPAIASLPSCLYLQGLRILEYACDHAAEHTWQVLGMWPLLEKEVKVGELGSWLGLC